MFPGLQAILGNMSESANYITRALPAGVNTAKETTVTYESLLPGLANVAVDVQDSNGDWQNIPLSSGSPVGDDWEERTHILENFTADETRVRITITGNPLYRPRLRALRGHYHITHKCKEAIMPNDQSPRGYELPHPDNVASSECCAYPQCARLH